MLRGRLLRKNSLFTEPQLFIASGNQGKIREISELLAPYPVEILSTQGRNIPEPAETEATFTGNALLKAAYYSKATGLPALADDSGLCVHGLNNAPGVYSARWAGGGGKDFGLAMERIQRELGNNPDRGAHFVCALALYWPDGHSEVFEGTVHGHLTFPPRGAKGFGYDPIFIPEGHTITFAEMEPAAKHAISHRARAFGELVRVCFCRHGETNQDLV